jgi:hypothetical protein
MVIEDLPPLAQICLFFIPRARDWHRMPAAAAPFLTLEVPADYQSEDGGFKLAKSSMPYGPPIVGTTEVRKPRDVLPPPEHDLQASPQRGFPLLPAGIPG